ncbi:hypothetical protein SD78_1766 [Bacillus badius]|nr:hypothetical protein SD78_1766 [Bacillus badius]
MKKGYEYDFVQSGKGMGEKEARKAAYEDMPLNHHFPV